MSKLLFIFPWLEINHPFPHFISTNKQGKMGTFKLGGNFLYSFKSLSPRNCQDIMKKAHLLQKQYMWSSRHFEQWILQQYTLVSTGHFYFKRVLNKVFHNSGHDWQQGSLQSAGAKKLNFFKAFLSYSDKYFFTPHLNFQAFFLCI